MESNIEFNGSAFTTAAVISGVVYGLYAYTTRGNNQNQNPNQRGNNSSWFPQNNNSSSSSSSWFPQFSQNNNNNRGSSSSSWFPQFSSNSNSNSSNRPGSSMFSPMNNYRSSNRSNYRSNGGNNTKTKKNKK
jgi:hypothetical protein